MSISSMTAEPPLTGARGEAVDRLRWAVGTADAYPPWSLAVVPTAALAEPPLPLHQRDHVPSVGLGFQFLTGLLA